MPLKRVPPPPPAGFGDEDYYRLYGRPEEYHRMRQRYERHSPGPSGSHQDHDHRQAHDHAEDHEEYYYYRRSRKDYEEEYDYYRGPPKARKPIHERLTWRRRQPESPDHQDHHRRKEYQNFKVTVQCQEDSEGTPSLSGVDTDSDQESSDQSSSTSRSRSRSRSRSWSESSSPPRKRSTTTVAKPNSSKRREKVPGHQQGHQVQKARKKAKKGKKKLSLYKNKEETYRQNKMMQKRLDKRQKRTSESDKNQALAKLAGIDIPASGARQKPTKARQKVGGMESHAKQSKRSRILLSRSRSKSPKNRREEGKKSSEKWRHDKFEEAQDDTREASPAFGSHWSRIRSERSKEREMNKRSRSRSYSSGSSSSRSSSRGSSRRRRSRRRNYSSSSSRSSSASSNSSESVRRQVRSHKAARQEAERKAAKAGTSSSVMQAGSASSKNEDNERVSMALSGNLLKDTNTVNGVVVRYAEPPEARKPKTKWRLYVFKGNEELPILYVHRQSCYLLGRDRKIADIPLDHPSCSKQHAVLQYRLVPYTRHDGSSGRKVTPYIVDMNSANGTFVNNKKIEPQKYVELLEKDVLKFGFSSREYVMLHDQCKEDEADPGVD